MESALSVDAMFRGKVMAAAPLRGGAVFRWESATAGVLILAALGCHTPPPNVLRQVDSLVQLAILAGSEAIVGYRGSDATLHYFTLPHGKPCAVPVERWEVTFLPVTLGLCLPLFFDQGKLAVPPQQWSMSIDLTSLQWTIE